MLLGLSSYVIFGWNHVRRSMSRELAHAAAPLERYSLVPSSGSSTDLAFPTALKVKALGVR